MSMDRIEVLKKKGFRITPQRIAVLKSVYSSPKTVEEIYRDLTEKNINIDLVSVYRILQFFTAQELLHEINFGDGKKRYEIARLNSHHHHIICNNCGDIEDITLPDEEKIIGVAKIKTNFIIKQHTLEFFGLCDTCQ